MTVGAEELKQELIRTVAERVRGSMDPGRAESPERFVRQFYANVAPTDLLESTPDNLYGAALALWSWGAHRKPGTSKVRVFDPQVEEHGWRSRHTVVEIVTDDMPFLVDSMASYLAGHDAEVQLVIHPIVSVKRNKEGALERILAPDAKGEGVIRESYMHIQVAEQPEERHEELQLGLARVLSDIRAAVEDWGPMRDRVREVMESCECGDEELAFLEWLLDDHFTFLGYREYVFDNDHAHVKSESGLGVLRDELAHVFDGLLTGGKIPVEISQPELIRVVKSNNRSTVHRPARMDILGIKVCDDQGKVVGERLFIGLFTSVAYAQNARRIPLLRRKVARVLERSGFERDGHDYKRLEHILDSYPRDELVQIEEDQLLRIATGILQLQERQRVALFTRIDAYERFASCLVYVPRDVYDTRLRLRFQEILCDAFNGSLLSFYTRVTDTPLARLLFIVKTTPGEIPPYDEAVIERRLIETARSWNDRLRQALVEALGEQRGLACLRRYGDAFPGSYRDTYAEGTAVFDIQRVEEALESGAVAMNLYRPLEAQEHEVSFKIYACGRPTPLSHFLPMLENMGLRVLGERPYRLRVADRDEPVWIRDVYLETEDGGPLDLGEVKAKFQDAFAKVWSGETEGDGFNKLVLRAGLTAREVTILRAYCKFLRQARTPFSQEYVEATLAHSPHIARHLVEIFHARFDPAFEGDREAVAAAVRGQIESDLDSVTNLDEDRIIRRFLDLMEATLRTNYYQDGGTKGYVSFKLGSRDIHWLPRPRPALEIFVYSPRVEAVHLRGGPVARGGIRWSDRREDFRTEVLGLMKAQMVKNAVIVPVGSKGGFVVKRPPEGRDAMREEVVECYRTMMRGLLDVTDNLDGDVVVPPAGVVRRDEDDPYLVVAADKGTATFSDTANGIAREYGFWLDDAFASGGSAGYDHKKMGITARGAWESVKRHFREMGKNIQEEDFTCVGVGDMAGDVFGNGMLLSRHIRLLGAFNHLHIFVDPDPDAARSWEERKRLFDMPGSAWTDYDASLISKGGGVFERSAKSIPLSGEMRAMFGLKGDRTTPSELIHAMLQADVELLWLGGIGTYVRATDEGDERVGDRANDALRINAAQLRAQVVGEGANLGLTQRARIEYCQRGGRINTDSIDNSAGVDTSDHEVNVKILLGEVERAGDITRKQRDELLEQMTDEVAELVLRDNYLQTQSITVTQQLGVHLLDRLGRFMRALEKDGRLDRGIEFLPDDETLAERMQQGVGLTRPEISVLLSYAKIVLYKEILASDLPDDPCMARELSSYFPKPLRERFGDRIARHRLRREIIATIVTNDIVNRVGVTFVHEVKEKTGLPADEIARAYIVSREISGMPAIWHMIEKLDNQVPAGAQATLLTECGRLMERATVWFLRKAQRPIDVTRSVEAYREDAYALATMLADVITPDQQVALERRIERFMGDGAPADISDRVARLSILAPAGDIVNLARAAKVDIERAARAYFGVGLRFGFNWLRGAAAGLPSDTAWDKLAVGAIIDDLDATQTELTGKVLEYEGDNFSAALQEWCAPRGPLVLRNEQLMTELQSMQVPNLAMLTVAARQLKSMAL